MGRKVWSWDESVRMGRKIGSKCGCEVSYRECARMGSKREFGGGIIRLWKTWPQEGIKV